jgi:hypothetical protein
LVAQVIARIRPIALDTMVAKHRDRDVTLSGACQPAIEGLKGVPTPSFLRHRRVKRAA